MVTHYAALLRIAGIIITLFNARKMIGQTLRSCLTCAFYLAIVLLVLLALFIWQMDAEAAPVSIYGLLNLTIVTL